ncbi:PREDICTED: uncharacterized protein LOC109216625 [Nicotiana attenuata]|uniref:uncharacterized protein LOC109216625 n=1 Tax=Nicotiana attenuata TaxID=49451 RepID=UPI000904E3C0|nr:PREDICTED: uncharacterized protein LOC109216625 [Nicotiana attenuata]
MDGYFMRIWGDLGIDKVAQLNRGVFLVRFHSAESRSKVVEEGVQMFDRKPAIVKPWKPDMEITKEQMEKIPIWVRFTGLDIKYWGKVALTKIAGLIGKPLKADTATTKTERLMYARVLVEVKLNQQYPISIKFENEVGKIVEQDGIMSGNLYCVRSVRIMVMKLWNAESIYRKKKRRLNNNK